MNNYKRIMTELPFDPGFSQKTIRVLHAYTDTLPPPKMQSSLWTYGRIALVTGLLLVTLTTAVFAAVHLLAPSEVAEYFGNTELAAAFENEDAVIINEEIVVDEYTVALNGIVCGADVGEYVENEKSSYIVLSVRYTDGRAITPGDAWEDDPICRFTASPYVHGKTPSEVNLFALESRASKGVIGNVLYILIETDKLSGYAGTPMYLGVAESDRMALFTNDEMSPFTLKADGEVILKESFDKDVSCVVFKLPL